MAVVFVAIREHPARSQLVDRPTELLPTFVGLGVSALRARAGKHTKSSLLRPARRHRLTCMRALTSSVRRLVGPTVTGVVATWTTRRLDGHRKARDDALKVGIVCGAACGASFEGELSMGVGKLGACTGELGAHPASTAPVGAVPAAAASSTIRSVEGCARAACARAACARELPKTLLLCGDVLPQAHLLPACDAKFSAGVGLRDPSVNQLPRHHRRHRPLGVLRDNRRRRRRARP